MLGAATEIAVFAGPVILSLMGVAVAVWSPKDRKAHWIWVVAFTLVGVLTIIASIKQVMDSDAAQTNLADSLKTLTKTVDGLQDAIKALTKPIPKEAETTIHPARDPDAIYQNDIAVGRVVAPRITLNESKIYFDEIQNAGNLDRSKPFEYRDFVLKMISAESYVGMLVTPSGVATSVYRHVVCEIVGRTTTR
jgi:hypothetical protein